MPRDLFGEVVHRDVRIGARQWYGLPLTVLVHAVVIATIVIAPLVATDVLPALPSHLTSWVVAEPPAPPPVPQPVAPVRITSDLCPPAKIKDALPVYPDFAMRAHIAGMVVLEATIDTSGKVINVRVLRSVPLLDHAAIDAVRQWEFTPTRLNGVAVPVVMTVTVNFSLR